MGAVSNLTFSIEKAGQLLGLGRTAAYEAARRGEIPTIDFGRRKAVPKARLAVMLGYPPTYFDGPEPEAVPTAQTEAAGPVAVA